VDLKFASFHDEISVDGLFTQRRDAILAHKVADCVPVVLMDRKRRALMTLHAGWRGLTQGIIGMGLIGMQAYAGSDVGDIWVWIGPCIQAQSYITTVPPVQMQLPSWKGCVSVGNTGYHVDMPKFITQECMHKGVDETHIINDGRDTYTMDDIFYSHKRAKDTKDKQQDLRFAVLAWLL